MTQWLSMLSTAELLRLRLQLSTLLNLVNNALNCS